MKNCLIVRKKQLLSIINEPKIDTFIDFLSITARPKYL